MLDNVIERLKSAKLINREDLGNGAFYENIQDGNGNILRWKKEKTPTFITELPTGCTVACVEKSQTLERVIWFFYIVSNTHSSELVTDTELIRRYDTVKLK